MAILLFIIAFKFLKGEITVSRKRVNNSDKNETIAAIESCKSINPIAIKNFIKFKSLFAIVFLNVESAGPEAILNASPIQIKNIADKMPTAILLFLTSFSSSYSLVKKANTLKLNTSVIP